MHVYFRSGTNECLTNPCHSQAVCTNITGNVSCTCNTGYTGNGTYCAGKTVFHSITIYNSEKVNVTFKIEG
jgi:hypothetical protein